MTSVERNTLAEFAAELAALKSRVTELEDREAIRNAIASYLISLYCSLAVQSDDALAVLEDVEIGKYHEYPDTYK